jgi:flagella basal body P-ring formation protein FlgA
MLISFIMALLFLFNPSNSLKEEINSFLKKNLSSYKDFEYEIVQMPENFKEVTIEKTNDFSVNGSLAYIPVKVVTIGNRQTRSFITIRLKLFEKVLVASKDIAQRENLTKDDFRLKKVDITQVRGNPVLSFDSLSLYRSKISIKSGDILIKELIEEKPIINAGDVVTASYTNGTVTVSTEAFSKQDGCKGETITIVTRDKKQFKAKVIDSKHVNIIE